MAQAFPELWVLRHGQTEWNRAGRFQGHLDSPLTPLGETQAAAQNRLMRGLALPPDMRFFTSPLGRARRTAEIALEGVAREITADDRLMEIDIGDCSGLTVPEIHAKCPEAAEDDGLREGWCFDMPGGDGEDAFRARIGSFLKELRGQSVIVTHGITSQILRGLALGRSADEMLRLSEMQGVVYHIASGKMDVIGA
ncbi:histidine phosphatase family protein [Paracoccaceae bacterium GXU_MW_L88]